MLVGELERKLLDLLPAAAAEPWDRTGMLVGNPLDEVSGVAVALDPTREAIAFAKERAANVLVTHHPMFLDPPSMVKPASPHDDAVGARIWDAVRLGVSVISFHTALDAHPRAAMVLADPLGLAPMGELLEDTPGFPGFGYGRICQEASRDASQLALACKAAFGGQPRLWGDAGKRVERICLWTGAAGDSPAKCLEADVDLLICGEVKYHTALDACDMGLAIVELGHDVSEQVHCPVLVQSVADAGIPRNLIHEMPLPRNWRTLP